MPNLRSKRGDSNPGSLNCESGILARFVLCNQVCRHCDWCLPAAEQTVSKNKIRWWSHVKRMARTAPPESSTRDPPTRKTTKGKARKSLGIRCSEIVQEDGEPDDTRQQLGEGQTSDCISTRLALMRHIVKYA